MAKLAETVKCYSYPLCRWRSFKGFVRNRVVEHLLRYHDRAHQYVRSGTKQLKVIAALWDHDTMIGYEARSGYLRRSADILRKSVVPGLSGSVNAIDKQIRLAFTKNGPVYLNAEAVVDGKIPFRRVHNIYYTHDFAEMLKAEVLVYNARVKSFLPRLAMRTIEAGNPLASLYPSKVACWWPLIEDIMCSPVVDDLKTELKAQLVQHEEYESISVDTTMRVTLSILGQPHPRAAGEHSAFEVKDRLTRVLTVRGRTNAVIAMTPMSGENTLMYSQLLSECILVGVHGQVRFLAIDDPSLSLWQHLKKVLPNLTVMNLDPGHLAIVSLP